MKLILRDRGFSSEQQLRLGVPQAWEVAGRDREFLARLTGSMPRRLNAVIEADGGPTRY